MTGRRHVPIQGKQVSRWLTVLVTVLMLTSAGAAFNFGISPGQLEKGVREPGERFFGQFFVVSEEDDAITVEVDTDDGSIDQFQNINPNAADNFSAQRCKNCFEFLHAGGELKDRDGTGRVEQWKNIEFFVDVPDDAEPGYHMVTVTPRPTGQGGGGGVGMVSSATLPVTFQVPGKAVRSADVLGVYAGKRAGSRQEIVTTVHNTGTVTMNIDVTMTVPTKNGNRTVQVGEQRVPPRESVQFMGRVSADRLQLRNDTFTAWTTADYTTGTDNTTATLTLPEPTDVKTASTVQKPAGPGESGGISPALLLILLLVSSFVTWTVIRHRR